MTLKVELKAVLRPNETANEAMARVTTTPECLSASVLTLCQNIDRAQITELAGELERQTAAIHKDDMGRAESMLIAQAHTLDGLFARLANNALTAGHLDVFERYMRLALKAQNQTRATLQTLAELKTPKQVAFVKQTNIGNQLQVNNGSGKPAVRARGKIKMSQTNYWRHSMANGWTPERRARQAAMIRQWQPWRMSTGPTSDEGKARAACNAGS